MTEDTCRPLSISGSCPSTHRPLGLPVSCPSSQGRWKLVTQLGVEAQLESLGLTGEARDKMAAEHMPAILVGWQWAWRRMEE